MSVDVACGELAFVDLTFAGLDGASRAGGGAPLAGPPAVGRRERHHRRRRRAGSASRPRVVSPIGADAGRRLPARRAGLRERASGRAAGWRAPRSPPCCPPTASGRWRPSTPASRSRPPSSRPSSRAPWSSRCRASDLVPPGATVYATAGDAEARADVDTPFDLAGVRALIVNEREALLITGEPDAEHAARALAAAGAVRRRHARSARRARRDGGRARARARRSTVEAVDTTGAGDLFTAAYVWADRLGAPLEERLRWAALYAALSVRVADGARRRRVAGDARRRGRHARAAHAGRVIIRIDEGGSEMRVHVRGAAVGLMLAALVGCGSPGGDDNSGGAGRQAGRPQPVEKPDVAAAGDVTLTVWDQEVRGGQAAQIKRLNQAFQEQYPNVTIKRVARSFEDLNKTLKLAVSGPNAPDVVQANQGRPVMGTLVKGGLLRAARPVRRGVRLGATATPTLLLDLNRFSSDGNDVRRRQPLRALADGRDRRRLLQQVQGVRAAGHAGGVRGRR